jgi:SnoaL-like protein
MHYVNDELVAQVVDEQLIRRVVLSYAQGVDRKDWDQVLSCYHEDAFDSHGSFEGSPKQLVEWMKGTHRNVELSMHVLTNTSVRFLGPGRRALAESYSVCYKTLTSAEGDAFLGSVVADGPIRRTVGSRFIDLMEDRGSGWRIARRDVVLEFARREPNDLYLDFTEGLTVSRRDRDDLLYRRINAM